MPKTPKTPEEIETIINDISKGNKSSLPKHSRPYTYKIKRAPSRHDNFPEFTPLEAFEETKQEVIKKKVPWYKRVLAFFKLIKEE